MNAVDPVEDYVAGLASALRGPARAKARMVEEVRDGLADAIAAHTNEGMPYRRAAHRAVREFGTADEILPSFQRELAIVQTRHTARTAALTVPLLLICWLLIGNADHGQGWQRLLTVHLTCVAVVAGVLAMATLTATGPLARRLPTPHRLPMAVAWTGTSAAVAMGVATLALAISSALATNWPLTILAGALTAASHALVAASSRSCRQCARLVTLEARS
jgi:hypothetical protein